MPEKTGKSLAQWKKILKAKSFSKHSEGVNYLKAEHGVSHGFANSIVTSPTMKSCIVGFRPSA